MRQVKGEAAVISLLLNREAMEATVNKGLPSDIVDSLQLNN